jgi:hypothetical protein
MPIRPYLMTGQPLGPIRLQQCLKFSKKPASRSGCSPEREAAKSLPLVSLIWREMA